MRWVLAAIGMLGAGHALAWDDLERMTAAEAMGNVLASEDFCGLTYKQEAVAAYIDQTVPANDMEFAGMLNLMVQGTEFQLQSMSESQRTAHCRQIGRVAASHGFVAQR